MLRLATICVAAAAGLDVTKNTTTAPTLKAVRLGNSTNPEETKNLAKFHNDLKSDHPKDVPMADSLKKPFLAGVNKDVDEKTPSKEPVEDDQEGEEEEQEQGRRLSQEAFLRRLRRADGPERDCAHLDRRMRQTARNDNWGRHRRFTKKCRRSRNCRVTGDGNGCRTVNQSRNCNRLNRLMKRTARNGNWRRNRRVTRKCRQARNCRIVGDNYGCEYKRRENKVCNRMNRKMKRAFNNGNDRRRHRLADKCWRKGCVVLGNDRGCAAEGRWNGGRGWNKYNHRYDVKPKMVNGEEIVVNEKFNLDIMGMFFR